ncbi:MAG: PorV/PorQ family protein [candidate division Zixibacteria bacterium]|nr:PorV/PorQ family protein [candidate division Zixibacteria bacterium]
MLTRHVVTLVLTCLIVTALATSGQAQVSSASALFLRIAPGARAAAMGESFVAVADDATTTYWNPAGLGAYPLSDSWKDSRVPNHLRPLRSMVALRKGTGSDYQSYEIWAISTQGLVRYDYRNWYTEEIFNTRTDQTVSQKVTRYFNEKDEERLAARVAVVAEANSPYSKQELLQLRDNIIASIPEDYPRLSAITDDFDTLTAAYDECRINWDRFETARKNYNDGMKDSVLSEVECDRINIAIENARSRFIPEELKIPYAALFEGELTCIVSGEKSLLVGTTNGLYFYNGKTWRTMTELDGLPSSEITALYTSPGLIYVGTSKGLVSFAGAKVIPVTGSESLPGGRVSAVGPGFSSQHEWVVIDNDLYSFNGDTWSNSFAYTVVLDDTPESIADKFAIYGLEAEKSEFIAKMLDINQRPDEPSPEAGLEDVLVDPSKATEVVQSDSVTEATEVVLSDSVGGVIEVVPSDSAGEVTEVVPSDSAGEVTEVVPSDSVGEASEDVDVLPETSVEDTALVIDETLEQMDSVTTSEVPAMPARPVDMDALRAGDVILVPYVARIRGDATSIYSAGDRTWLGTDYGLVLLSGDSSRILGYGEHVVAEGETLDSNLIGLRWGEEIDPDDANLYREALIAINDLDDGTLQIGDTIKVYRNALASRINKITGSGKYVYLATANGLRFFDKEKKRVMSVNRMGLDRSNAINVIMIGDELWMASEDRVVAKANARSEYSLMHVNWLPELDLADDIYYEFFSGVHHLRGWGTVGFNFTYLTYGSMPYTDEQGHDAGMGEAYEFAVGLSYGASLTQSLKGGISAKVLYSHLSEVGELSGEESGGFGDGTATGVALDLGLLYHMTPRLNLGMSITNIGPEIQYSQDAQSDPLPRNLAIGFAYKLLRSDYNRLLITGELNKQLVSIGSFNEEIKETIINTGAEFVYADLIALRAGYKHDEDGKIKILTLGVGLTLMDRFGFDFSYIPSNNESILANTLRMSLSVRP